MGAWRLLEKRADRSINPPNASSLSHAHANRTMQVNKGNLHLIDGTVYLPPPFFAAQCLTIQGCASTSSKLSLFSGSSTNNFLIKSLASALTKLGIVISHRVIRFCVITCASSNGASPTKNSYVSTPKLHRSTFSEYQFFPSSGYVEPGGLCGFSISGGR